MHSLTHSIASELEHTIVSGVTKAPGHLLVHYYFCVIVSPPATTVATARATTSSSASRRAARAATRARYAQKGKPAG